MLGSRWTWSGASISIVEWIWLVTSVPQNDLILSLALLVDIDNSKKIVLFSGLFLGPLQIELICGSSWWYRPRQEDSRFDSILKRLAMDVCRVIGVMSLFC
jgi:hypothetical protein